MSTSVSVCATRFPQTVFSSTSVVVYVLQCACDERPGHTVTHTAAAVLGKGYKKSCRLVVVHVSPKNGSQPKHESLRAYPIMCRILHPTVRGRSPLFSFNGVI